MLPLKRADSWHHQEREDRPERVCPQFPRPEGFELLRPRILPLGEDHASRKSQSSRRD